VVKENSSRQRRILKKKERASVHPFAVNSQTKEICPKKNPKKRHTDASPAAAYRAATARTAPPKHRAQNPMDGPSALVQQ
jgi:hypothetical protein